MLPAIRSAFAAHGLTDIRPTRGWRDERNVTLDAIAEGCSTIVVAGGDGTCGNVANAILHSGADTCMGVIPAGTGNDFAKTLRTNDASIENMAQRATQPSTTRIDVGRVDETIFLNSCGFGFDVAVLQGLLGARWLKGNTVYLYNALRQLLRFEGLNISIESPVQKRDRTLYMMLVIANCPYFGGAFIIAPRADVTDGELDAVSVLDASPPRRLRLLAAATRGLHPAFREVEVERASEFTIRFDDVPFYETDGEVHQASGPVASVRCIPEALRVVTGDGFGIGN
jgi:diacylglycerol kinase (ATP)